MTGDLDALLDRANARQWHRPPTSEQSVLIDDLAAAVRTLRTERDTALDVIRGTLTTCRECRDEAPPLSRDPLPPAEFIIWGKLCPPDGLGPKCYGHAVKWLGHHFPGQADQYAVVDLRPLRAVLAAAETRHQDTR